MNAKQLMPIMVSDFLFWSATAGLGPIMSRLAEAELDPVRSNLVIAHMLLAFTLGSLAGRALAGLWPRQPKYLIRGSIALSGLGLLHYFSHEPNVWLLGHILQGIAMGLYGISMFRLASTLIPAGERMRGFALIGMADFLGFAFGPVISGLLSGWGGFSLTFVVFLFIICGAFISSYLMPDWVSSPSQAGAKGMVVKLGRLRQFLPLHLGLLICLFFHIFYSRYLPIIYDTGAIAIESWFFSGYILGGIGIRLGLIRKLEAMPDRRVFALSIGFISLTAILVGFFPTIGAGLGLAAMFTGVFYGLGFEALYIFCLTYIANNSPEHLRGRSIAFVFMGFDLANLIAGLTFGPLANQLTPKGLGLVLLVLIPFLLSLPLFLSNVSPIASEYCQNRNN